MHMYVELYAGIHFAPRLVCHFCVCTAGIAEMQPKKCSLKFNIKICLLIISIRGLPPQVFEHLSLSHGLMRPKYIRKLMFVRVYVSMYIPKCKVDLNSSQFL